MRFAAAATVAAIVAAANATTATLHGALDDQRQYMEGLVLRPLPHLAKVVSHFHFDHTTTTAATFDVFPQSLRHVVQKYGVEDLELTFTTGLWRSDQWGDVLGNGPHGVSLKATLEDPSLWTGLTQQLAGLFSASLNKMDGTTVSAKNASSPNARRLHGILPREELCTENISPWLKMLPCRTHAGLGAWIRPVTLLDADFLSITLRVVHDIPRGTLHLHQSLTAVRRTDLAAPSTWSLQSLLGLSSSTTTPVCALAHASDVTTDLAMVASSATLTVESTDRRDSRTPKVPFAAAAAATASPWLRGTDGSESSDRPAPWWGVSGHRYLTGYGQVRGGVGLRLTNHHPTKTVRISYHEAIPWYLRVYFSTLRLRVNGRDVDPLALPSFRITVPAATPSQARSPFEVEFAVEMAPQSELVMAYSFDKAFLPMSAHPPDSNRGFDVPAASWSVGNATYYTEPLLVPLPTPDFSMPYNVIMLTSTVVGMSISILVNTLLNRERRANLLVTLVQKLAAALKKKTKEKTE